MWYGFHVIISELKNMEQINETTKISGMWSVWDTDKKYETRNESRMWNTMTAANHEPC